MYNKNTLHIFVIQLITLCTLTSNFHMKSSHFHLVSQHLAMFPTLCPGNTFQNRQHLRNSHDFQILFQFLLNQYILWTTVFSILWTSALLFLILSFFPATTCRLYFAFVYINLQNMNLLAIPQIKMLLWWEKVEEEGFMAIV